jgi:Tol biopolymer transport system component
MPMGKLRPYLATAVLVLLVSTAFAGSIRTPTIVWSSSRSGTLGIWAMNPDGTGQRQLTDDTGRDITPSISPDGRSIAFSSYRGGGLAELWVMNQDGSGLRRVASVPGLNVQWPTWSPDGGMLYFDAVAGASSGGLYSVRLDGTDLTRLLSGYAARPEVSPDGTEIWFDKRTSSLSYSHQLFKMDIDGTDVVQLTSGPSGEAYTKSFGGFRDSDGRIVYTHGHGLRTADSTVPLSDITVLTTGTFRTREYEQASWSPDGTRILHSRKFDDQPYDIWTCADDGTDFRQLTFDPANDIHADWGVLTPEPGSAVLVLAGMGGLLVVLRRRRHRARP